MAEKTSKTALVLAGGGIMGAAYEIGCLSALERLFGEDHSTTRFDIYVGISAGSVIATLTANRIHPHVLFSSIANDERRVFNWRRKDIYRIDGREIFSSCCSVVRNLFHILRSYREKKWKLRFGDLLHILQEQFPAGLFSLEPLQNYLCRSFAHEKIIDDFNLIEPELYIPAYDLDKGERVVFGTEGFRGMHICHAITASCAIPYFFRPHKIDGHHYIDGSTGRVSHIDVALERGAKLIVVINPRVPMHNDLEKFCLPSLSFGRCSSIAELGISYAWEQSQRIENKEKLDLALELYRLRHPDVDIVVIEPGPEESLLFFQGPMSNEARHHTMTYGYHLTLSQLRAGFEEYREIFARHGIAVTAEHLEAPPPGEESPPAASA